MISNGVGRPTASSPSTASIVAPGVYGPHHQHFFNVRLDMAVDGTANRVYEVTPTARPGGPGNPVGNAWRANEVLIEDETMARREADPLAGRYWKIVNENVTNELGQPVAYKLMPEPRDQAVRPPRLRGRPARAVHRSARSGSPPTTGTSCSPPATTRTSRDGRRGLPAFAARDRNLTDTDVVLWFTFGTNHVVRPEDWPVMPVHPIGFKLLPSGFFVGNPALDNPQPGGDHCHHH